MDFEGGKKMKTKATQNETIPRHPDVYHQKAREVQKYIDAAIEDAVEIVKNMKKKQAG